MSSCQHEALIDSRHVFDFNGQLIEQFRKEMADYEVILESDDVKEFDSVKDNMKLFR